MAGLVFGLLNSVQSLLFSSVDHLDLGATLADSDVSVTSSGIFTSLNVNGTTLSFPTLALSNASQQGNVTFAGGENLMVGTANGETLDGTAHDDKMYGMDGNDLIKGEAGNDYLFGGAGSDVLQGGDGGDHMYGFGAATGVDGNDSLLGEGGNDYLQGNMGSDTLDGGEGSDRLLGGQDDDYLFGGIGNDSVNGNLGNDHIDGGSGEDFLRGGKGDDNIAGGDGNDTIMGDLGADTLNGGAGADLFKFDTNDAATISLNTILGHMDTVTDFTIGTDHLSLAFMPAAVHDSSATTLAGALTWAVSALTGHGGDVATVEVGADTYLFYSSSGGSIGDSVIDLQNVHGLTLGSFV